MLRRLVYLLSSSTSLFNPAILFAGGEQGAWYDPSDVANLSWRRNLLTRTEELDDAVWSRTATVTANQMTAPDGTMTADLQTTSANFQYVRQSITTSANTVHTVSFFIKPVSGGTTVRIFIGNNTSTDFAGSNFSLTGAGSLGTLFEFGSGVVTSRTVTQLSDGWYRCTVSGRVNTTTLFAYIDNHGTASMSFGVWGAQLEIASAATDYQRIADINNEVAQRFPTNTLFQDVAGTQPVTTPGQTVALMLDKSRQQIFNRRTNLLSRTEDFSNAVWVTSFATVTPDSAVAPDGTITADLLTSSGDGRTRQSVTCLPNTNYTGSVWLRVSSGTASINIYRTDNSTGFDTSAASVTTTWQRFVITGRTAAGATLANLQIGGNSSLPSGATLLVWGAQLEVGSVATTYQPVNTLPTSWLGNHASQATSAQRPTYGIVPAGGRRNLLTFTKEFDNAAWLLRAGASVNPNQLVSPDGTANADVITTSATFATCRQVITVTANIPYTLSIFVRPVSGGTTVRLGMGNLTSTEYAGSRFNLTGAGSLGLIDIAGTATITNRTVTQLANGWYRCSITGTVNTTELHPALDNHATTVMSYGVWGAQLEVGSTVTNYQRVVTAFEVTEVGVPSMSYLSFDGVDDGMLTGNIVPGTDKVQAFVGVRKLSDAAAGVVAELSPAVAANNGAFAIRAPGNAGANYYLESRGTLFAGALTPNNFPAPITNVVTVLGDIAGDSAIVRVNGTQAVSSTVDQGTGNYLTYPLHIGRRAGAVLPFNGQIFGLILRFGPNLSSGAITQAESWVSNKTGFYLPRIVGVPTIGVSL